VTTVRFKPSVEPFAASTGDIYLLRGDGAGDFVLRHATPFAYALVDALGGEPPADLASHLAEAGVATEDEARVAIAELHEAGLVLEESPPHNAAMLSSAEAARYDRQLHYFGDQSSASVEGLEKQAALRDATVVVLGAGGLGTWALAGLACAGVGHLVAVDHDRVDLSNLNRQVLYRTADVGRPKVEVAGEALGALNPHVEFVGIAQRIEGVDGVRSAASGADFVVCTADWPAHHIGRWVNEACLDWDVPHISAGQFPPRVRVGPTFVPGRTACLACEEVAIRRDFPLYDELVEQRRRAAPVAATLGAASGLIGSLLAMEVIHWITGIAPPATLGRGLVFDLRDFSSSWEVVTPEAACPLGCGAVEAAAERVPPAQWPLAEAHAPHLHPL
jgi:bacteriocin biosynthesis cyclodehydratase domain-containing protein